MAKRKKSRRARGTGSIRFDAARGVWVGRSPVGRLPGGRTRYREVSGATQAEVVRKLRDLAPAADATLVRAWAQTWQASLSCRERTRAVYATALRTWILPAWGHLRLIALTPSRVEELGAEMAAAGRKASTITLTLACAGVMLNAAVRDGAIPRNPVSVARKPKKIKKKIDPFAPAELLRIIAAAGADARTRPLALMAAAGCRIGEALALEVGDFDGSAVSITKSVGAGGVGPPKSANGVRTIRVPAPALPSLVAAAGGQPAALRIGGTGRASKNFAVSPHSANLRSISQ